MTKKIRNFRWSKDHESEFVFKKKKIISIDRSV